MELTLQQITDALGLDANDLALKELRVALRQLERRLDAIAADLEDDFLSGSLGDASNLIQLIRRKI